MRRHGWHGGPPPLDFLFGSGGRPPWAGKPGWGPPPKAKRGDVRATILALLAEGPRNGYQIIQEIHERTEGGWKPSPGAVYPALQQLADEGLIIGTESEGKKTFSLTEAGRAHVEQFPPHAPWEERTPGEFPGDIASLFKEAAQLGTALVQVVQAGSPAQISEARRLVSETKRNLYGILADATEPDEPEEA